MLNSFQMTPTAAAIVCAGHARINGEPYVLLDRSIEEVVSHMAKDLEGRIRLSWPVTRVRRALSCRVA